MTEGVVWIVVGPFRPQCGRLRSLSAQRAVRECTFGDFELITFLCGHYLKLDTAEFWPEQAVAIGSWVIT